MTVTRQELRRGDLSLMDASKLAMNTLAMLRSDDDYECFIASGRVQAVPTRSEYPQPKVSVKKKKNTAMTLDSNRELKADKETRLELTNPFTGEKRIVTVRGGEYTLLLYPPKPPRRRNGRKFA